MGAQNGAAPGAEAGAGREAARTEARPHYSTPRVRRTKAALESFDRAIREIVAGVQPATVQQVWYRSLVAGLVPEKEPKFKRQVTASLERQRWNHSIPFEWISDETRGQRMPEVWGDAQGGLAAFAASYRRDLWRHQPRWVELWVESDSLAGTLVFETWELGVPLLSGRGWSSLSSIREAARQIRQRWNERGQPTDISYVGDLDPPGWSMSEVMVPSLLRHLDDLDFIDYVVELLAARGVEDPTVEDLARYPEVLAEAENALASDESEYKGIVSFTRLAVNPSDVTLYQLPRGGKPKLGGPGRTLWRSPDGPNLAFTVEAEAFDPNLLRALVRDTILNMADIEALNRARRVEELERETLETIVAGGLSVLGRYSDLEVSP